MNEGLRTESWNLGLRKGSIREAGLLRLQQEGSGSAVQKESPGHPLEPSLPETENITGARRTRATPVGLRSEGGRDWKPRPDQTRAALLASATSLIIRHAKQAPRVPLEGCM